MWIRPASLVAQLRRSTPSRRVRVLLVLVALAVFGAQLVLQEHLTRHELGLAGHVACETCLAAKSLTPLPAAPAAVALGQAHHSAPMIRAVLPTRRSTPLVERNRGPPVLV